MQSVLRSLLSPDVVIPITDKSGIYSVSIKETGVDAKLKKLEIKGLDADDLVFTLDYQPSGKLSTCFKQLSCYLNVEHDKINKGCDFVLITRRAGQLYTLIGELKSNRPKESDVRLQLKNSQIFLDYILCLTKAWHGCEEDFQVRKVCVHSGKMMVKKRSISRRRRQPDPSDKIHFYPVRAPNGRISLTELIN